MAETDDNRFCKDCKYAVMSPGGWTDRLFHTLLPRCARPEFRDASVEFLVDGKLSHLPFCGVMRASRCGTEGRFWEPKLTEHNQ